MYGSFQDQNKTADVNLCAHPRDLATQCGKASVRQTAQFRWNLMMMPMAAFVRMSLM